MTEAKPVDPKRGDSEPTTSQESEPTGPKVTDKRRLDPKTGAVRSKAHAAPDPSPVTDVPDDVSSVEGDEIHPDTTLAEDLTRDLQRLQAEYVNYKKRVDRDRELHHHVAVGSVVEALLPVLDDVHLARQHGDLEGGPFAAIADKLEATLAKFGVERFGQPGDAFDPTVHEALMHIEAELAAGTEVTTVVQVLQPGYKMGERLVRAARVAVADPK
ncbi:MAG: nucleotide exchange factor GrpE [Phycicoccus sp.]|nr:nucleotide exchange factor GrpE [Phycicoccus sp.]